MGRRAGNPCPLAPLPLPRLARISSDFVAASRLLFLMQPPATELRIIKYPMKNKKAACEMMTTLTSQAPHCSNVWLSPDTTLLVRRPIRYLAGVRRLETSKSKKQGNGAMAPQRPISALQMLERASSRRRHRPSHMPFWANGDTPHRRRRVPLAILSALLTPDQLLALAEARALGTWPANLARGPANHVGSAKAASLRWPVVFAGG